MSIRADETKTETGFIAPRYYAQLYDRVRPWRHAGRQENGIPIDRLMFPTATIPSGWLSVTDIVASDDSTAMQWAESLLSGYEITADDNAEVVDVGGHVRVECQVNYSHHETRWVGARLSCNNDGSYTGFVLYAYMSQRDREARDGL